MRIAFFVVAYNEVSLFIFPSFSIGMALAPLHAPPPFGELRSSITTYTHTHTFDDELKNIDVENCFFRVFITGIFRSSNFIRMTFCPRLVYSAQFDRWYSTVNPKTLTERKTEFKKKRQTHGMHFVSCVRHTTNNSMLRDNRNSMTANNICEIVHSFGTLL